MSVDFARLATPGAQALSPYRPGRPAALWRRGFGAALVNLASNENPLGPSPAAAEAAAEALAGIARYPDGNGTALKDALAERWQVSPARITLGCGSNDVLCMLGQAWLAPGRSAVLSEHAFIVFSQAVTLSGARGLVAPARAWGHDPEAMLAAVAPDTRALFIANPNNPTGTWIGEGALTGMLERLPEDVIVVLDEAYAEYAGALAPDYPDSARLLARFPNLVVTRTFSKIHGLAGARVGYAVSDAVIAETLNRVRQPFNVSHVGLAAALAALDDDEHIARSLACNAAGMQQLRAGLADLGLGVIASAGNFLAVALERVEAVCADMLERAVLVRPLPVYGMPGHIRVTVGVAEENARCLDALRRALERGVKAA